MDYRINSLFINLPGTNDVVGTSLSKTEGWYYRCDNGPWKDRAMRTIEFGVLSLRRTVSLRFPISIPIFVEALAFQ